MTKKISRRTAVMVVTGATLAGAAAPAVAEPDAELLRLGRELDREMACERRLIAETARLTKRRDALLNARGVAHLPALPESVPQIVAASDETGLSQTHAAWGDCQKRIMALTETIRSIKAATIAGLAVQATALLWDSFLWDSGIHGSDDAQEDERPEYRYTRDHVAAIRRMAGMSELAV